MKPFPIKGLVPIALSGISLGTLPFTQTLLYSDFDKFTSSLTDQPLKEHLDNIESSSFTHLINQQNFYRLYQSWSEQVMFLSSPIQVVDNANFRKIVQMGNAAVPFILAELKKQPSYIVLALNYIFKSDIITCQGTTIAEASKKWIKFFGV